MGARDPVALPVTDVLPERVDVVVVGGGASGLSLAAHLATSGWRDRQVVVVDDGSRGLSDRAWAFWSAAPGLLDGAVSSSFDRFAVRTANRARVVTLGAYRYRVVRGGDLSATVEPLLRATPGVRRHTGHVSAVLDGPREAEVLVDGRTLRADWVFDSVGLAASGGTGARTPRRRAGQGPRPAAGAVASLVFSGRRVETEVDTFDPALPVLMDFRTSQRPGVGFVYLLPTSARSALVEHTRFSRGADGLREADADLDTYLHEVLDLGPHRVVGTERGRIRLGAARPPAPLRRVVPIGAPAGMVKASTGYGYARMQRHSAALVGSLVRHGHPFDVPSAARRYRWLDRVLLTAAAREPERVVDAFDRLFARNPGDRVLSFLDEDTTLAQELVLVRSLPPGPFLRATLPRRRAAPL